jgi:two-component system, sensor histidine kinase and response regulator
MDGYLTKPIPGDLPPSSVEHLATSSMDRETSAALQGESAEVGWDLTDLLERLEGDHEFLRELLLMFRRDCRSSLQRAQRAMADGDFPELSRAAHTIKGMLRNLSMNSCAEAAVGLEKSAQSADESEAAEFLASLESALAEILPRVDAQLGVKT